MRRHHIEDNGLYGVKRRWTFIINLLSKKITPCVQNGNNQTLCAATTILSMWVVAAGVSTSAGSTCTAA